MRTRAFFLLAIGLVAVGAFITFDPFATAVEGQSDNDQAEPDQTETDAGSNDINTSEVLRETLTTSDDYNGELTFGDERTLSARAQGTLTWVPEEEAILQPGDVLWEVDRQPVIYIEGTIPMYRDLYWGAKKGDDILQLEQFLIAEGYGPDAWEADDSFNRTTRNAVKEFQKAEGMTESGLLGPAHVVVGTEAFRVSATADLGADSSEGPTLTVTDAVAEVTMPSSSRQLATFQSVPDVLIVLADGREVPAVLDDAEATPAGEDGRFGYSLTYVVEGTIGEPQPVKVKIVQVLAENALTVPVDALVALAEGGYAVEVGTESGGFALRAVEVVDFDDTRVAITGNLDAGDLVVIP